MTSKLKILIWIGHFLVIATSGLALFNLIEGEYLALGVNVLALIILSFTMYINHQIAFLQGEIKGLRRYNDH